MKYFFGMDCDRCSKDRFSDTCYNGDLILHGDRCLARCDPGYAPTAFSLDCRLGILYPPTFGCTEVVDGFDHDSQLLEACRVSDVHKIDRLVAMRAKLDFKSPGGDTALHLCALHGDQQVIRRLLLANAATNARNERHWTPLHVAASRGHTGSVSQLLAHSGDVLARNDEGNTPGDLARLLSNIAQPQLGKQFSGQHETAMVLMQAERLRANKDCSVDHTCPAPLPGGWHAENNYYVPPVQAASLENVVDDNTSTPVTETFNHTNTSNDTLHDTSTTTTTEIEQSLTQRHINHTNESNSTSTTSSTSTTTTTSSTTTTATTDNSTAADNSSNHTQSGA